MNTTKKTVYAGLFIALGLALSIVFHSLGGAQFGSIFLPLHFVVLLAGFTAGPWVGLTVGALIAPLSGVLFGMPPLMPPIAFFMALEMATYGFLSGYFEEKSMNVYVNLAITLITGRVFYSLGYYVIGAIMGIHLRAFTALLFSFAEGAPGILIQFLLIPTIYYAIKRMRKERT
jgi:predicted membrane protein